MGNGIEPLIFFKKLRSGTGDCKNQRILNGIEPLIFFKKLRSGTGDCKNQRILGLERPYSSGGLRGVSDVIGGWIPAIFSEATRRRRRRRQNVIFMCEQEVFGIYHDMAYFIVNFLGFGKEF
ncbi:hypothetical protein V6N13_073006 [Hibiscus sabdariffa]|uniref:Uncharacterized protein n=1 Tax=Hibiscus sabdariffa TaxID=183260 RepID=A0ABR2E9M9_9ROSI